MHDNPTIHRRSNRTIDIDAYRQEALTLRAETSSQIFKYLVRTGRPLLGAIAVIAACAFLLPRSTPPACAKSTRAPLSVSHCPSDARGTQESPQPNGRNP